MRLGCSAEQVQGLALFAASHVPRLGLRLCTFPLRALESRGSLQGCGCPARSSLPALSLTLTIHTASMGPASGPSLDPPPGRPYPDPHCGDVPTAKAGTSPSPVHPPTH